MKKRMNFIIRWENICLRCRCDAFVEFEVVSDAHELFAVGSLEFEVVRDTNQNLWGNEKMELEEGDEEDEEEGEEEGEEEVAGVGGFYAVGVGFVAEERGGDRPLRAQGLQPAGRGPQHHGIDGAAGEEAEEGAAENVAGIVEAEIDARVAAEAGPEQEGQRGEAPTEVEREEGAEAEGVGGMAGDEAVEAPSPTLHEIHEAFEQGLVAGAEAVEEGLAEAAGEAVGDEDEQGHGGDDEEDFAPGAVLQQDVEQHEEQGHPRAGLGHHHEDVVHVGALAAVQGQQQALVKRNHLFHEKSFF